MQYENGFIELTNSEASVLSYALMNKIERFYKANEFIAELVDIQQVADAELSLITSLNDRTSRNELQAEILQLTRDMAKVYEEKARKAMEFAGHGLNTH